MENAKQYFAFISYKREDEEWAKWLQHKLEHYKLPSNLNGRTDLPKEIRPVFKDTSELNPGNLPQQIHDALEQSKHLIVICSPRSARSEWVNKEVENFIGMGKTDHIIPFIIEGKAFAKNPEEECFPEAIRNLPSEQEILGANISEMGRDAAAVKVVAQMFGLRFDELWQRYEREQRKRRNKVIFGVAALALIALGVAGWIWKQNVQLKEKDWSLMASQSRFLSEKAMELASEGDVARAIRLCLEILPKDLDHPDRPYVSEAEYAFRQVYAMDKLSDDRALFGTKINDDWETVRIINSKTEEIYSVGFSPDNQRVVTSSESGLLRIYDLGNGNCVYQDDIGYYEDGYAEYSPDGGVIASTSWGEVYLIDANTFEKTSVFAMKDPCRLDSRGYLHFNNDGKYLVSGLGTNGIRIFDVSDPEQIKEVPIEEGCSYGDDFAISNDGKEVLLKHATANYDEFYYIVIDIATGKKMGKVEPLFSQYSFAYYDSTGDYIQIVDNDTTYVIDRKSYSCVETIDVAIDKDGLLHGTYGWGKRIYNSDGSFMAEINRGGITFFKKNQNQDCTIDTISIVKISPDESLAATVPVRGTSVSIWSLESQKPLFEFEGEGGAIIHVDFSPDGERLVVCSQDGILGIWNTKTGKCERTWNEKTFVWAAFSRSSRNLVAYSIDDDGIGELRSYDFTDGSIIWSLYGLGTYRSSFEMNGDYVYCSTESFIVNVETGKKETIPIDVAYCEYIADHCLQVHPNKALAFALSCSLGTHSANTELYVYDFIKKDTLGVISPNDDRNYSFIDDFAVSNKGNFFVTESSSSNQICLYETESLKCMASIEIPEVIEDGVGNLLGNGFVPKIGFTPLDDAFYYEGEAGLFLYSTHSGEMIDFIPKVNNCGFSNKGNYLICQDQDKNWSIIKYHSLKSLLKMVREKYDGVAFTPEERHQYYLE